jgi:tight adherence protein C
VVSVTVAIIAVPVGLLIAVLAAMLFERRPHQVTILDNIQQSVFADTRDQELSTPFGERVLRPALARLGKALASRSGSAQMEVLQRRMNAAGGVWGLTPAGFLAVQVVLIAVGAVTGALLGAVLDPFLDLGIGSVLLLAACGAALGFLIPRLKLARALKARQEGILRALPNALDLLTICVEAGLSFEMSLQQVVEKYANELSREFMIMLNEIRLGRPRREVLAAVAERIDISELTSFLDAVQQSEQLGTPLAQTLRIQSEEIRRRFRQRAEEQGQKAPLKMLFPMVGCIFPTLFVVLLGPAAVTVFHSVLAH